MCRTFLRKHCDAISMQLNLERRTQGRRPAAERKVLLLLIMVSTCYFVSVQYLDTAMKNVRDVLFGNGVVLQ